MCANWGGNHRIYHALVRDKGLEMSFSSHIGEVKWYHQTNSKSWEWQLWLPCCFMAAWSSPEAAHIWESDSENPSKLSLTVSLVVTDPFQSWLCPVAWASANLIKQTLHHLQAILDFFSLSVTNIRGSFMSIFWWEKSLPLSLWQGPPLWRRKTNHGC